MPSATTRITTLFAIFLFAGLGGCAGQLVNHPINLPLTQVAVAAEAENPKLETDVGDVVIGLSFSGGGTRAAAFAHGVMLELADAPIMIAGANSSLLDHVRFVSGVSGGSVAAAYFGLKGKGAINDFRERFLTRNAEENLRTAINPTNVARLLKGGLNDARGFPRWLDKNLFNGATFGDLNRPGRPYVFINASDIFNRIPFVYDQATFSAICSELRVYPLASAVGASAAVPFAFSPEVIQTFPHACQTPLPHWVIAARQNPDAPASLRSYAAALSRYRSGEIPYIKLVDGGVTDNLGLYAFLISRQSSQTPYSPLTPENAVRLREIVLFVVNAGTGPSGDWIKTVEGPSGTALLAAVSDTLIDSSIRGSLDSLRAAMESWEKKLRRYRCSLSRNTVRELRGTLKGWRCGDLKIRITEINFEQLDPSIRRQMDQVPTRFSLPEQQVDLTILAARQALVRNPVYRALLGRYGIPVPAL